MKEQNIFCDVVDDATMEQFTSAMSQDFVTRGALMPDAHLGYTLPIGSVIETEGVVVPSYVGFDCGCGLCAVPLEINSEQDPVELVRMYSDKIFNQIYKDVPVGVARNSELPDWKPFKLSTKITQEIFEDKGLSQIGTLGTGNHFIEVGYDETHQPWIIVHSGSRGLGHAVATHYMRLASPDGKLEGHNFIDKDLPEGKDYLLDLDFCLSYALYNRILMVRRVAKSIRTVLGCGIDHCHLDEDKLINRNHNHAEVKGDKIIHRKGATHAELGMMGVIPGNMRDGSFIVRGKGYEPSMCSSSHGAGRVLGRDQAKKTLSVTDFESDMEGIKAKIGASTLDESPAAYKNIFEVMAQQSDMVEVVHHIKPIINVKG